MGFNLSRRQISCPNCNQGIQLFDYYIKCGCGTFSKEIIEKNDLGYTTNQKKKILSALKDVDQNFQHFLWSIVKEYRNPYNYFLKKAALFVPKYTFFEASSESIKKILKTKHIQLDGRDIVFPLTDNDLICKFLLVNKYGIKKYKFLSGGCAFSFTLTEDFANNILLIFQNPLSAFKLIVNTVEKFGKYPTVISADVTDCYSILLKHSNKEIILVLDDADPSSLKQLLPFSPRIVFEKEIANLLGSYLFLLPKVTKEARPLKKFLPNIIPFSRNSSILVKNNSWYLLPRGVQVLNCDIKIKEVWYVGKTIAYCGTVVFPNKVIPFVVSRKQFFDNLQKLCLKKKQFLICYRREVQNRLEELVLAKGDRIKVVKKSLGCIHKKGIYLPNIQIVFGRNNVRIAREKIFISGKRLPGGTITPRSIENPAYVSKKSVRRLSLELAMEDLIEREDEAFINCLVIVLSLACVLAVSTISAHANTLIFVCKDKAVLRFYLKQLGIPIFKRYKQRWRYWPIYINNIEKDKIRIVSSRRCLIFAVDDEVLANVLSVYKSTRTIITKLSSISYPLLSVKYLRQIFLYFLVKMLETPAHLIKRNNNVRQVILNHVLENTPLSDVVKNEIKNRINIKYGTRKTALHQLVNSITGEKGKSYSECMKEMNKLLEKYGYPKLRP